MCVSVCVYLLLCSSMMQHKANFWVQFNTIDRLPYQD